jgi:biofilm PGA synthesis lipoprotein PgaB
MRSLFCFITICLLIFSSTSQADIQNQYISLCYHDIRDDVDGLVDDDQMAFSTNNLVAQFSWLREHGYNPISIDDIEAAKAGKRNLPDKAVLITFDDGYKSVYTHVFPLLQQFNYPAVIALVGKWLDTASGQLVEYGDSKTLRPRSFFMDWDDIHEMSKSPLIEIASHSYNMHRGVLANPQGNTQPAAVSFQYFSELKQYEALSTYKKRIRADLKKNNALIKKYTGISPRSIVWPYGAHSQLTEEIATSEGLHYSLTLKDGVNNSKGPKSIKRILLAGNTPLEDFVYQLRHPVSEDPIRVAHVDLDYIYDEDPKQIDLNLSALLDRIKAMQINTVFLQAFADPDGDGNADALYFPNRHLPVRKDLFNRVSWQLKTRANVNVYAWMPVLSFILPASEQLRVYTNYNKQATPVNAEYIRLSPFNERARTIIEDLYEDLAIHANFSGLLFHDDAYLNDFEDVSPAALKYTSVIFKEPNLNAQSLLGPLKERWTHFKTEELTRFTLRLANRVKYYRPDLKTARNIYANVILNPNSEEWFAQNYNNMLANYDYTAVMAMPYMEGAADASIWLQNLVSATSKQDPLLKKTLFELQSVNWRSNKPIANSTLTKHFRLLMRSGAKHLGYYPDNFIKNHPSLRTVKSNLSLNDFPFEYKK